MKETKFIGAVVDPWVLNETFFRVFPEDDGVGIHIDPLFTEKKLVNQENDENRFDMW